MVTSLDLCPPMIDIMTSRTQHLPNAMQHGDLLQENMQLKAHVVELERKLDFLKNQQEEQVANHVRKLVEVEQELLAKQNELDESIAEVLVRSYLPYKLHIHFFTELGASGNFCRP